MPMTNRRVFMIQAATCAALPVVAQAATPAPALVDEKDAQASALGYVADTNKTDKKKFPKHEASQKCNNCALYQGKVGDAQGGCPLFAGKQVTGPGWCSAWAKKA